MVLITALNLLTEEQRLTGFHGLSDSERSESTSEGSESRSRESGKGKEVAGNQHRKGRSDSRSRRGYPTSSHA